MTQITVRVDSEKVRIGLKRLSDGIEGLTAEKMLDAMVIARDKASTWTGGSSYSTSPPRGSTYARTGIYGGAMQVMRDGQAVRMTNNARAPRTGRAYAQFVGGDSEGRGQARIHAGRWPVIREVVEKETDRMIKELDGDIESLARRSGL